MTIRAIFSFWLVLFLSLFFIRCDEDPKVKQEEKVDLKTLINGSWILKKGYRNRKESVGLENTSFEFNPDGRMSTNFNIESKTETHNYVVENNIIRQDGKEAFTYHIYEVSDSSLTLETRYRGHDFKLILEKWKKDGRD